MCSHLRYAFAFNRFPWRFFVVFNLSGVCVCLHAGTHNLWLLTQENGKNVSWKWYNGEMVCIRWICVAWCEPHSLHLFALFGLACLPVRECSAHFISDWWESPIFNVQFYSSRENVCNIAHFCAFVPGSENCCISSERNPEVTCIHDISLHVAA